MKSIIVACFVFVIYACSPTKRGTLQVAPSSLRLIDVYDIPYQFYSQQTTVGGLSGIDFDSVQQIFYTISDDRSALQPARFYSMKILFSDNKIDTVLFQQAITLQQPNGQPYPSSKENPQQTPDPEAIRYNPIKKQLVWTSEGERIVTAKDTVIADPSIQVVDRTGKYIRSFSLPDNLRMSAQEKGPRRNGVLEGATFTNNYQNILVSLEEPRYEDGEQAKLEPHDAWVRLYKFNVSKGKAVAQYAYKLDPVAYAPNPPGSFMVNGIPDIMDIGNNKLLVMERSFSTGRLACTIKIFMVDLNDAEDISSINSLKNNPPQKPLRKKLLLNLDELGIYTDNVEGMCLGPRLKNGKRSLWMIADNNFSALEKSQLFLFEVNE
ncbi:MAG: esterase-like activity of phytase family protein [Chitinophagaceae bacterium]|nr:esterase-like activity of phytase family protein [Chitinophagaceae bacterium]